MVLKDLTKLEIAVLNPSSELASKLGNGGIIKVLFNPNSYSISKPVTWNTQATSTTGSQDANGTRRDLNAPTRVFAGGGSRTLSLKLFYDVTEPINGNQIKDVRVETNKIVLLTQIERDSGQPPICQVSWGVPLQDSDFPFKGYVSNLTQEFVLFRRTGEPIRANLNVTFTEHLDPVDDKKKTDPELTTRVVKRKDTLSSIAAEIYHDPGLWRLIAEANHMDDPRDLNSSIGKRLTIPDVA